MSCNPCARCWPSLQLGMFRRATSWKSIRLARHRNSSCGLIKCHWCADSMPSRGYSLMWRSTERTTPSKLLRLFRVQQGDSLEGPSWRDGGNACGRNFPGVLSQNIGCPSFLVSSFFTYFLGVNQVWSMPSAVMPILQLLDLTCCSKACDAKPVVKLGDWMVQISFWQCCFFFAMHWTLFYVIKHSGFRIPWELNDKQTWENITHQKYLDVCISWPPNMIKHED